MKDDGNVVLPPAPGRPITPPGAPEEPALPDEDVELEEPELPEIPEETHADLDALRNGAAEEEAEATVETEEYDGAAPEGEPADEDVPPSPAGRGAGGEAPLPLPLPLPLPWTLPWTWTLPNAQCPIPNPAVPAFSEQAPQRVFKDGLRRPLPGPRSAIRRREHG